MKKFIAGFALIGAVAFASAQSISFDKTTFDYGTVRVGSDGQREFVVTNTGDKPLILSSVKASCGCTTPVWSQDPIMPGKSSLIKVGYNTATQGDFTKMIEVFSNDPVNSRSVLYIKGKVDPEAPEVAVHHAADPAAVKAVPAKSPAKKTVHTKSKKKRTAVKAV